MRWWGWGEPDHPRVLPDHAVAFLRDEVGMAPEARPPAPLDQVRVSDPALPDGARDRLAAVVGAEHVRDDLEARVVHAAGKSYPDLLRQRAGDCEHAPDAVVYPADHEQVVAVLATCAEAQVAVVPFGGGTSVVGGVEPLRGEFPAVVTLDLRRLDRVTGVDRRSLTATLEPGLRGPAAEAQLNAQGLLWAA
jgi:alkyldihydroxyacetonephosphate synthase